MKDRGNLSIFTKQGHMDVLQTLDLAVMACLKVKCLKRWRKWFDLTISEQKNSSKKTNTPPMED